MKSISDNIITFDATLCIRIQNEDFVLDNQNLISQLNPLLSSFYDSSAEKYVLPSSISNSSFEHFLNIVNHYNDNDLSFINSLSLSALVNVVNIAILLKSHKIVDLLTVSVKGRISLQSIIDIIISFYPIKEKHAAIVKNVITPSIEFIIENINVVKHDLNLLPCNAIDQIAEEFLKANSDKELEQFFIDAMMTSRKITNNNIYDLLEIERKKIANDFETYHKSHRDKIDFVWKIKSDDITEGIFKEENCLIENLSLTLIAYYEYSSDTFHLAMQMKNNIDTFGSTNSIVFTGENEATLDRANDNEVISLLSICEIPEINFKSKINFNCVYYNIKSKVLIYKINNLKYKFNTDNSFNFTLNLFFNRNFLFPSLLNYISTNFSLYSSLPSISAIPKVVLMLILNNANLSYSKEDDLLTAILNWVSNKDISKLNSYSELFTVLKWNFVSIEAIAKMLTVYAKITKSVDNLIEIISKEINSRTKEPLFMKDFLQCIVNSSDVQFNKSISNNTNSNISSNFTSNCEANYDTRSNNTSNTYLIKVANSRRTPSSNRNIKLSTSLSKKNCLRKGYRNTSPGLDKGKNNSVDDKTANVITKVKKLYSKYRNVDKSLSTYMKNKSNSSSFTKQSDDIVIPIRKYNVNSVSSQRNEIAKTETNKIPFNGKKINKSTVRHHPRSKSNY